MFSEDEKQAYKAKKDAERKAEYDKLKAVDVSNIKLDMPYYVGKKSYLKGETAVHLTLACIEKGYRKNIWLTFKQVSANGWRVKHGEKATDVSYSKPNGQYVKWLLFNIEQTTGDFTIDEKSYSDLFKKDYQEWLDINNKRYGEEVNNASSSFSSETKSNNLADCENKYYSIEPRKISEPLPEFALDYKRFDSKMKLDDGFYAYGIMYCDHMLDIHDITDNNLIPYSEVMEEYHLTSKQLYEKYGRIVNLKKKDAFPESHTEYIGEKGKKQRLNIWGNIAPWALSLMHDYMNQKGIEWTYDDKSDVTSFELLKA